MLPITDIRPSTPAKGNDRPTLVMSHSFGCARREWIEVAALLSDEYRTVTIDVPGFGEAATWPATPMRRGQRSSRKRCAHSTSTVASWSATP